MPRRLGHAALFALALAVAACGGGGSASGGPADPPPPASAERQVLPSTVDPAVDRQQDRPHVVIAPGGTQAGRLFVMLAGTGGQPSQYREVLRVGAARGLHAVGLDYPNPQSVGSLCAAAVDDCFWAVRREVVTGQDLSPRVTIAPPDAIVTRLARLLVYLDANFPAEGWGRYLTSTRQPDWSRIVVAGHSQGGGHAAVIAKLVPVARAVYFASPADWQTAFNRPAPWMAGAGATPPARQLGFTHLRDGLVPYGELVSNWAALGLDTPAVSVDSTLPPYGGSRTLTTALAPAPGVAVDREHGAPVLDSVTPRAADGSPVYAPVWVHLAFTTP